MLWIKLKGKMKEKTNIKRKEGGVVTGDVNPFEGTKTTPNIKQWGNVVLDFEDWTTYLNFYPRRPQV